MSDFKAKMHKIPFPLGLPAGGAYSAPTDPLAVFKLPTSKGEEGEDGGKKKGKERGRGRMEGKGPALPTILASNRPCFYQKTVIGVAPAMLGRFESIWCSLLPPCESH